MLIVCMVANLLSIMYVWLGWKYVIYKYGQRIYLGPKGSLYRTICNKLIAKQIIFPQIQFFI